MGVGLEAEGGASRGGEGAVRGRPMSGESRKGSGEWELGKNKVARSSCAHLLRFTQIQLTVQKNHITKKCKNN